MPNHAERAERDAYDKDFPNSNIIPDSGDATMSAVAQPALTTAEEFVRLPEKDHPRELVRGNIVEDVMPGARHGKIGVKIARLLGNFVEEKDLGHVMSNDTFVRTHRDPDSVRGSDICYFSYDRLPRGPVPEGIVDVAPELVFEVRSPSDRWVKVISKTAEYLEAGVSVVCIVGPS